MPDIGPLRRFKSKKGLIAHVIRGKTPKQCEEKYKTATVENNITSESKTCRIDIEHKISKICLMDDSIEPAV